MEKDHKKEIKKILLNSADPAKQLSEYHRQEAKGIILKNDIKWFILCIIILLSWVTYLEANKPQDTQIFKSCTTKVDSIKVIDANL